MKDSNLRAEDQKKACDSFENNRVRRSIFPPIERGTIAGPKLTRQFFRRLKRYARDPRPRLHRLTPVAEPLANWCAATYNHPERAVGNGNEKGAQ
ncbi:hypothetical protein [Stenotrophomonas beteli]|uniref:hypothetical protein n=1 Tax=Stenotrophomonas beteli TaxID=3384461 RepID=UPI00128F35D4|nr:hypothetical protein [Stenotrophomonas maltophilia]